MSSLPLKRTNNGSIGWLTNADVSCIPVSIEQPQSTTALSCTDSNTWHTLLNQLKPAERCCTVVWVKPPMAGHIECMLDWQPCHRSQSEICVWDLMGWDDGWNPFPATCRGSFAQLCQAPLSPFLTGIPVQEIVYLRRHVLKLFHELIYLLERSCMLTSMPNIPTSAVNLQPALSLGFN